MLTVSAKLGLQRDGDVHDMIYIYSIYCVTRFELNFYKFINRKYSKN